MMVEIVSLKSTGRHKAQAIVLSSHYYRCRQPAIAWFFEVSSALAQSLLKNVGHSL